MFNEAYKMLIQLWSYRYNTLAEMIQKGIGFLAIGFVLGQGNLNAEQMAFVLPGWMMSFYARIVLFQVNGGVTEEARTGTLEQMYMSPVSSGLLLLGRAFAILIVATIMVVVSAGTLMLLVGIRLPLRWEVLPVIALTLIGLFGFSFLLGGAALVFKSVHSIADLTQDLILFVNGTFVSVSLLPFWLQTLGLALPTTYGIVVLRKLVIDGDALDTLLFNGSLPILSLHSAAYFIGGWLIYAWCERIARRQGSLGQY
jgi:ABC-2 type transport system permease protein